MADPLFKQNLKMSADEAAFEAERDHLVAGIVEGLGDAVTHLRALNRNLEGLNQVAAGFEGVSDVWTRFHQTVKDEAAAAAAAPPAPSASAAPSSPPAQ